MSMSTSSAFILDDIPVVGDDIPVVGDIIKFKLSFFDNNGVDSIQNNLPLSIVYFGAGPETVYIGCKGDSGWHALKGRDEKNPYTINTLLNLNGVTAGVSGGSLILSTKVQLEHVAVNLYQPIPDAISVWDNTHVRLNDVTVNAKFWASKELGFGTIGLKAYGINQYIEDNGFKTNGGATVIKLMASNFTGHFPESKAPEVTLLNVDTDAFASGIESNDMEVSGNTLGHEPAMKTEITLNRFNISVNSAPLRLNDIKGGAIATWGDNMELNEGKINVSGDVYSIGCSSLGVRCTTVGVVADGGSVGGSNLEINANGNEIGGVYAIGRVVGGDPTVDFMNTKVTTNGLPGYGLYSDGSNIDIPVVRGRLTTINAEIIDVNTSRTRAYSVFANNGAVINIHAAGWFNIPYQS